MQLPSKDPDAQQAIATVWRPTFAAVVKAFTRGDFTLSSGVPGVAPISPKLADQLRRYLEDYGETLTELSEDTWKSSVAQWSGTHWDVLVDLWTLESGRSDLVLDGRVYEAGDTYRYEIHLVYVP